MTNATTGANQRQQAALNNAIRDAKTKPGFALPNGATILAQEKVREQPHCHEFIVLAVSPGFQPYITWRRVIGTEQKADGRTYGKLDYCIDGHYHRELHDAVVEYTERVRLA